MEQLEKMITTKLVIGDWSEDGHKKSNEFYYEVNYSVHDIREGYKKSCKAIGVQFNDKKNYTGLAHGGIWADYTENYIKPKDAKLLKEYGILSEEFMDDHNLMEDAEGYVAGFGAKDAADLIMRFINYSMPVDFIYRDIELPDVEPINGWWNNELDVQFGYGLYD